MEVKVEIVVDGRRISQHFAASFSSSTPSTYLTLLAILLCNLTTTTSCQNFVVLIQEITLSIPLSISQFSWCNLTIRSLTINTLSTNLYIPFATEYISNYRSSLPKKENDDDTTSIFFFLFYFKSIYRLFSFYLSVPVQSPRSGGRGGWNKFIGRERRGSLRLSSNRVPRLTVGHPGLRYIGIPLSFAID